MIQSSVVQSKSVVYKVRYCVRACIGFYAEVPHKIVFTEVVVESFVASKLKIESDSGRMKSNSAETHTHTTP